MASAREQARDELRADVALMRSLGVARWGEIVLGPSPTQQLEDMTPEERAAHVAQIEERERARRHEILFASTGIRPKLPKRAPEPESVVQRSRPQEHDRGPRRSA